MDDAVPERIACPICDALHHVAPLPEGAKARCVRCHTVLAVNNPEAVLRVVVLSITALILMGVVVFYPFLELRQGVVGARASVFDTVMAFSRGVMAPLSIAVGLFIIVLPTARLLLALWALGPVAFGRAPWTGAATALRWAIRLKLWAMAEIFMIGVAVALVKLADLATLTMGPAFWSFAAIVVITTMKDTHLRGHSVWTALDTARKAASKGPTSVTTAR